MLNLILKKLRVDGWLEMAQLLMIEFIGLRTIGSIISDISQGPRRTQKDPEGPQRTQKNTEGPRITQEDPEPRRTQYRDFPDGII